MFRLDTVDKTTIKCTRGDRGSINIKKQDDKGNFENFIKGDKVIFSIKNNFSDSEPVFRKIVEVEEDSEFVTFELTKEDTTLEDLISSPKEYQYDVSINDDLTIIGYDDDGPKIFRLYPEGSSDN